VLGSALQRGQRLQGGSDPAPDEAHDRAVLGCVADTLLTDAVVNGVIVGILKELRDGAPKVDTREMSKLQTEVQNLVMAIAQGGDIPETRPRS